MYAKKGPLPDEGGIINVYFGNEKRGNVVILDGQTHVKVLEEEIVRSLEFLAHVAIGGEAGNRGASKETEYSREKGMKPLVSSSCPHGEKRGGEPPFQK